MRLGNPLCCSLNNISIKDLQSERYNSLRRENAESAPSASTDALRKSSSAETETKVDQQEALINLSGTSGEEKSTTEQDDKCVNAAEIGTESTNKNAPFGGSLSLARVQSLVSMTTPRDGNQEGTIRNPPFVEFDLSIDGFACLFLPSVFPQSISQVGVCVCVHITCRVYFSGGGGDSTPGIALPVHKI